MRNRPSVTFSLNSKISFKVIVVGECSAGKTSLILRYVKGIFESNYIVTVGVEFYSKVLTVDNEQITLKIWDTAGQKTFKSIVRSFYNRASCALIIYAKPDEIQTSVENCILEINEHAPTDILIAVVRTKIDQLPVTKQEQELISKMQLKYNFTLFMEVSSQKNIGVTELFQTLGKTMLTKYKEEQAFREINQPKKDSFYIHSTEKKQKKRCC